MPLINIRLPQGVFSESQQQTLLQESSRFLLAQEGMADNAKAKMLTWGYLELYEPGRMSVGGELAKKPHYLFELTVFKGTMTDEHKQALTHELTELVLNLEGTSHNQLNAARVWVMFHEMEDGNWGGAGRIYRIGDLMKMMQ